MNNPKPKVALLPTKVVDIMQVIDYLEYDGIISDGAKIRAIDVLYNLFVFDDDNNRRSVHLFTLDVFLLDGWDSHFFSDYDVSDIKIFEKIQGSVPDLNTIFALYPDGKKECEKCDNRYEGRSCVGCEF